MKYRQCDELGANLFVAQTQWGVTLNHETAEKLIEYVAERYRAGTDFEELLERSLDLEGIQGENERHAYKCALGLFFGNRAKRAKKRNTARDEVPFAPR